MIKKDRNNELCHLREIYKECFAYGSVDEELINNICLNLVQYEKPDIYAVVNNEVYVFEHFEFDYYKNTNDGSSFQKEQSIEEYKINQYLNEGKELVSHKRIESNASVQNFINNFKNIFFDHYEKIDSYKERVDELCGIKRNHLWFIAEIISPIQCIAQTENGVELIHPLMFEDVYMSIKDFDKIEGLVLVNDGSFLIVPRRDYKKANRNYNADNVNLELTNPMSYRSIQFINLRNK